MAEVARSIPKTTRNPAPSLDSDGQHSTVPYGLSLELVINDPEVIEALLSHAEGPVRDDFARTALKIGISALRHASGKLDADLIQREGNRILEMMGTRLREHSQNVQDRVNGQLREYFDPRDGRFNERVQRLIKRDGELEQVLRRQIGSDDSQLAKTLVSHVGETSPLMKLLDPSQSQGLLAALNSSMDQQLKSQRERLLREFSLDNSEGALARLIAELTKNNGQIGRDLQDKIDVVVKEFSLDEENSALSRLVRNVDSAQKTISQEFSLDNPDSAFSRLNNMLRDTQGAIHENLTLDEPDSPLSRLKRELLVLLKEHSKTNHEFQEEIKTTLAALVARRAEAERSTRHGVSFEEAVFEFVSRTAQAIGDVATATGNTVGLIKNCKVGDCLVSLGADTQATGANIVVEAKEHGGYTLGKACEEMKTARKNRDAQYGVFVFSSKSAPADLAPFARYGDDLVVVWDAEDTSTDVFLQAALTTARALCVRGSRDRVEQAVDFDVIDKAILEIEKRADNLDEIRKSAETICSAGNRILDRVRISRDALERQVDVLTKQVTRWKSL